MQWWWPARIGSGTFLEEGLFGSLTDKTSGRIPWNLTWIAADWTLLVLLEKSTHSHPQPDFPPNLKKKPWWEERQKKNHKIFYRKFQWIGGQLGELVSIQNPKNKTEPGLKFLVGFQYCFFFNCSLSATLGQKSAKFVSKNLTENSSVDRFGKPRKVLTVGRLVETSSVDNFRAIKNLGFSHQTKTRTLQGKVSRTEQFSSWKRGNF